MVFPREERHKPIQLIVIGGFPSRPAQQNFTIFDTVKTIMKGEACWLNNQPIAMQDCNNRIRSVNRFTSDLASSHKTVVPVLISIKSAPVFSKMLEPMLRGSKTARDLEIGMKITLGCRKLIQQRPLPTIEKMKTINISKTMSTRTT